MKYLVLTEGTCEKAFLEVMIEKGIFCFDISDLLYESIYASHVLQRQHYEMINQLDVNEKVTIIRVKDKFNDKFHIDSDYKQRISKVINIRISPEFEILHILYLGMYDEYIKVKSKQKPCEFLPEYLKDYKKTYEFNYSFFNKLESKEIASLIDAYDKKRNKALEKNEKTLKCLAKES